MCKKKTNTISSMQSTSNNENTKKRELTDEEIEEIAEKAFEKTKKDLIEYRKNPPKNNVIFWRSNRLL